MFPLMKSTLQVFPPTEQGLVQDWLLLLAFLRQKEITPGRIQFSAVPAHRQHQSMIDCIVTDRSSL
jgi:hypothetical protein